MRRRVVAIALTLCSASGFVVSTASAAEPVPAAVEAWSDDTDAYASHHSISREAADRELADLVRVAALQEWLSANATASFGGIWISHDPDYGVNIALIKERPGRAARLAADFGIEAPIRQVDVRTTYSELVALADDLRARRQVKDHTVRIDVRRNRVLIDALDVSSYLVRADGRAARAAAVEIESVPRLGGPTIYAGQPANGCTFGWTVRRNGTTTDGITTAQHCDDAQFNNGVGLPFQGSSNGSADTQWHTTPGFVDEPKFRVNFAGDVRTVTSITNYANVVIGQTICKYGKTTGYGCGEVEEKTADAHWVENQTGRYISLKRCNTDLSTEGDSGGPVFFNYSAFGIVSGWQFGGLACKDELVFASVTYMQSNLPITIKLG